MEVSMEQEKCDALAQLFDKLSEAEKSIYEEGTISADALEIELEL